MPAPPSTFVVASARAEDRLQALALALEPQARRAEELWLVAPTQPAADAFAHRLALRFGGHFAFRRATFPRFILALSETERLRRELMPATALALEAIMGKVVAEHASKLGRFQAIADRPGLARALVRTCSDLRLAHVRETADPTLNALLKFYDTELVGARLADEAMLLECARLAWSKSAGTEAAFALIDVPLRHKAHEELIRDLGKAARARFATAPTGDTPTLERLARAWKAAHVLAPAAPVSTRLEAAQTGVFSDDTTAAISRADADVSVELLSAPGESRECVEIVRRVVAFAERGMPFDRIAIGLRAPELYGHTLVEALDRAGVPAYFARGTRSPDPAGRALLSLLWCAEERLSARRFAEYLSLGETPPLDAEGAPPTAAPPEERWVRSDDEWSPEAFASEGEPEAAPDDGGKNEAAVATPRLWEKILNDAAVIGTLDRWKSRLAGRRKSLALAAEAHRVDDDARRDATKREIEAALALERFALPILEDLERLRATQAPWSEWLPRLSALATRTLRRPARVLSLFNELAPLGDVRRLSLSEVRAVLAPRLASLTTLPERRRYGCVYVAPILALRAESFQVVFVPGMAERIFPARVAEDPVLLDAARSALSDHLATNKARTLDERLLLQVALGAATERAIVSYPRLDLETGRPRTPSSYMLDVVKAAFGRVVGFEELARMAGEGSKTRVGWPAPLSRMEAIDDAEHDLALLRTVLDQPEEEATGAARYLLASNEHLARALRSRARRWLKNFGKSDGLVDPAPEAKEVLAKHQLAARSFSPTALQNYAACPYRFYLYAILKLAPREEAEAIEEIGPLDRGSLVHELSYTFLTRLRDLGMLPVTNERIDEARDLLDSTLDEVAEKYRQDLFPAIARVWDDTVQGIRADAREWLRLLAREPDFVPTFFELSFGLENQGERDAHSKDEPVTLDCGIKLRGSIDLVERAQTNGTLRATDYKTGKQRATSTTVIGGGQTLQPVFYALVLEKLFPEARVRSGRLHYATGVGNFESVEIPLDDRARRSAATLADTMDAALKEGLLPAYPEAKGCQYCDYKAVCGPYEEIRAKKKSRGKMEGLRVLRSLP